MPRCQNFSGRSPSWRAKRKGVWGKEFSPARSVVWGGNAGAGFQIIRAIFARKKFEPRSAIATNQDFLKIWKRLFARSAPPEFIPHGDAGAGLASQKALYFGIKSKGGRKSKRIFLSSIWRFVAAKPPEQKQSYGIFRECFCFPIFSAFVKGEQKPVFNPVLSVPSAQCPKATNLKTI